MYAEGASAASIGMAMETGRYSAGLKKALFSGWIMDSERSERKPAASHLPAWARKARGINADKLEVKTVSFDETRTRVGVRRGENRRSAWIWTAAVEEWDGSRRAAFEVGCRDAETFLRLFRRLPDAAKYKSDH